MVVVAQLVRASDCGSESRRFESGLPPKFKPPKNWRFIYFNFIFSFEFANPHAV